MIVVARTDAMDEGTYLDEDGHTATGDAATGMV